MTAEFYRRKIESLEGELACAKAFHDVAVKERDFERNRSDNLDAHMTRVRVALDAGCPAEEGTVPNHRMIPMPERVRRLIAERDALQHELDFIKSEYGGADDETMTRDALALKLRLCETELDSERAGLRQYERAHEDILAALKKAEADAYHPEDGEPVALWGVEALVRQRDEARQQAARLGEVLVNKESNYDLDVRKLVAQRDEARAEVERLERLFQQTHGVHHSWVDARHKVAERQREACAEAVRNRYTEAPERVVRATPLVTEGEK